MASRLSDLVRDGALNEVLACLNRAASVERADSLLPALDKLRELLGVGDVLPPEARSALLGRAGVGRLAEPGAASARELADLVHLVLQRPDHMLAAYGTLVPGGRNHGRVAHLGGTWQRCFVRGRRWTAADGDPRFRWSPGEPEVDAMLLVSEDLPSAWPELDRFEGSEYRRHLVPVRAEDGHHVASLYESVDQAISK